MMRDDAEEGGFHLRRPSPSAQFRLFQLMLIRLTPTALHLVFVVLIDFDDQEPATSGQGDHMGCAPAAGKGNDRVWFFFEHIGIAPGASALAVLGPIGRVFCEGTAAR